MKFQNGLLCCEYNTSQSQEKRKIKSVESVDGCIEGFLEALFQIHKISDYADKIGTTRTMSEKECKTKLKKIIKFINKNKFGKGYGYCAAVNK